MQWLAKMVSMYASSGQPPINILTILSRDAYWEAGVRRASRNWYRPSRYVRQAPASSSEIGFWCVGRQFGAGENSPTGFSEGILLGGRKDGILSEGHLAQNPSLFAIALDPIGYE